MNTLTIPSRSLDIEIPSHWDEMTPEQVSHCLKQVLMAGSGLMTVEQARVRSFYHLAGIQRDWKTVAWERTMPKEVVDEKNANLYLLSEQLMGFLFRPEGETLAINYNTIMNHFPIVNVSGTAFYGPEHMLSDLTFGEFRAAVEEMNEYFESRDEHQLSRMLACLYRPERKDYETVKTAEDFDGQRRQPFNRALIEDNALVLDKTPSVFRQGVLLWFTYTIDFIQKEDLILGGRQVNFKRLFPRAEEGRKDLKQTGSGWTGVVYQVAKEGLFGTIRETDQAGLFDILLYMHDQDVENEKLKRKMKKK